MDVVGLSDRIWVGETDRIFSPIKYSIPKINSVSGTNPSAHQAALSFIQEGTSGLSNKTLFSAFFSIWFDSKSSFSIPPLDITTIFELKLLSIIVFFSSRTLLNCVWTTSNGSSFKISDFNSCNCEDKLFFLSSSKLSMVLSIISALTTNAWLSWNSTIPMFPPPELIPKIYSCSDIIKRSDITSNLKVGFV